MLYRRYKKKGGKKRQNIILIYWNIYLVTRVGALWIWPWVCPLSPWVGHGGAWRGRVMRSSAFHPFMTTQTFFTAGDPTQLRTSWTSFSTSRSFKVLRMLGVTGNDLLSTYTLCCRSRSLFWQVSHGAALFANIIMIKNSDNFIITVGWRSPQL